MKIYSLSSPHRIALPSVLGLLLLLLLTALPAVAQVPETAEYTVRFQATWSAATHPLGFPNNPHFSPLVGGVHDGDVVFWEEGGIASSGIEQMAERGRPVPLAEEVEAAIAAGDAASVLRGDGIDSPGSTELTFTVSQDFPRVTLVTMVAPSPDWFVGVAGLSLFEGGNWVEQRVVTLYGYDSGTDSGADYTSPDVDTQPREPIHRLTTGAFANGAPLGTYTFTRKTSSPLPAPLLLGNGRFKVEAEWLGFDGVRRGAHPVQLTTDTGYFWFLDDTNVEVVIKVLDACTIADRYWVYASGLTNVEVVLRVEDTMTQQVNVYDNPLGQAFEPVQDVEAFTMCP